MAALPYVTSPGSIEKALTGIRTAATPERVSQDFVKTILKIPGGSGNQTLSFLKKIGFVSDSGAPSDIYTMFRNPATAGKAAAKALKIGYAPLYKRNEYMHSLSDEQLRGLILEETGTSADSSVASLIISSMKPLKKLAKHSEVDETSAGAGELMPSVGAGEAANNNRQEQSPYVSAVSGQSMGLNLSYTINLNLPATSDVAVFNAIFKSLKENLLKNSNE